MKLLNFLNIIPTTMSLLITIATFLLGVFTGRWTIKSQIIKLTDTFIPKKNSKKTDAVLQLQNEIANADVIKFEADGKITLKVLK